MAIDLLLHIVSGTIGLISGAIALFSTKGSTVHRAAGNVFFLSMMAMASIGAFLAYEKSEYISVLAGLMTFYMVVTSWITVKQAQLLSSQLSLWTALFAGALTVWGIYLGLLAAEGRGDVLNGGFEVPAFVYYTFASFLGLGALTDLSLLIRKQMSNRFRITRHVWRMCWAMYIATSSLFTGQQQVFPEQLRGSFILSVPELIVAGLMLFWLGRVLLTKWADQ